MIGNVTEPETKDSSSPQVKKVKSNSNDNLKKGPKFGGVSLFGGMGGDISAAIKARNKTNVSENKDLVRNEAKPSEPTSKTDHAKVDGNAVNTVKNSHSIQANLFGDESDDDDDLFATVDTSGKDEICDLDVILSLIHI